MVGNTTAEEEVLGSMPGSGKVLLSFSNRNFLVAVTVAVCIGSRLMAISSPPIT